MDENSNNSHNNYTKVSSYYEKKEKTFLKSVLVPFISGVLGTILVIATCFSVPNIRDMLLASDSQTGSENNTSIPTSTGVTLDAVSLTNYSDTAVSVASKVLPSIVGIKVEYSVSSSFGRSVGTTSAEGSRNNYW